MSGRSTPLRETFAKFELSLVAGKADFFYCSRLPEVFNPSQAQSRQAHGGGFLTPRVFDSNLDAPVCLKS